MGSAHGRFAFLVGLVFAAFDSSPLDAGWAGVTNFSPGAFARGQKTSVEVHGMGLKKLQVEIVPPDGVSVAIPAAPHYSRGRIQRWTIDIVVDAAATPGDRAATVVSEMGRFGPYRVTIPDETQPRHSPMISDLKIEYVKASPPVVGFVLTISDDEGDFGDRPTICAELTCEGSRTPAGDGICANNGVIVESPSATTVRVRAAHFDTARKGAGKCYIQVNFVDESHSVSNGLVADVKF